MYGLSPIFWFTEINKNQKKYKFRNAQSSFHIYITRNPNPQFLFQYFNHNHLRKIKENFRKFPAIISSSKHSRRY
ncbi:hypothetical protein IGI04_031368 [Brassica rapa subsp. trilocularis]|uniref:Uncharacterized protein n=1 Tax=Brassica rapa subsp. trilocularis TaxID=1813537 RepID=A0ABQ7LTC5_BRACM|nr:hypothetical protein IGI04_031368 [Brassica rapa subsp. trilocularis]